MRPHGFFPFRSFVFLALLLGGVNACAFPVTWTLSGATFTDGGTATGSFAYDADTNTLSNWSVAVAGGNTATFPPVTFDTSNSSYSISGQGATFGGVNLCLVNCGVAGGRELRMVSVSPLSDAGGTVAIDFASGYQGDCFNCSPFRGFSTGSLVGTAAPVITSVASAVFLLQKTNTFAVTATGAPVPAIAVAGLPSGVTFTDNGDGTGTLAGIPTTFGDFTLTITATNGVAPAATQSFLLRVVATNVPAPALGLAGTLALLGLLLLGALVKLHRRRIPVAQA